MFESIQRNKKTLGYSTEQSQPSQEQSERINDLDVDTTKIFATRNSVILLVRIDNQD